MVRTSDFVRFQYLRLNICSETPLALPMPFLLGYEYLGTRRSFRNQTTKDLGHSPLS